MKWNDLWGHNQKVQGLICDSIDASLGKYLCCSLPGRDRDLVKYQGILWIHQVHTRRGCGADTCMCTGWNPNDQANSHISEDIPKCKWSPPLVCVLALYLFSQNLSELLRSHIFYFFSKMHGWILTKFSRYHSEGKGIQSCSIGVSSPAGDTGVVPPTFLTLLHVDKKIHIFNFSFSIRLRTNCPYWRGTWSCSFSIPGSNGGSG